MLSVLSLIEPQPDLLLPRRLSSLTVGSISRRSAWQSKAHGRFGGWSRVWLLYRAMSDFFHGLPTGRAAIAPRIGLERSLELLIHLSLVGLVGQCVIHLHRYDNSCCFAVLRQQARALGARHFGQVLLGPSSKLRDTDDIFCQTIFMVDSLARNNVLGQRPQPACLAVGAASKSRTLWFNELDGTADKTNLLL